MRSSWGASGAALSLVSLMQKKSSLPKRAHSPAHYTAASAAPLDRQADAHSRTISHARDSSVKKDGKWRILMERQIADLAQRDWDKLALNEMSRN